MLKALFTLPSLESSLNTAGGLVLYSNLMEGAEVCTMKHNLRRDVLISE